MVEPIISLMGGMGFFADKTARVLWLKPDGTETVLYRAADHWEALKPPGILEDEVKNRSLKLKQAGVHVVNKKIADVLGVSDSGMGSGVDYRLFYLEDGLAIVNCAHPAMTIKSIHIEQPGLTNLSVNEWLGSVR